MTGSLRFVFNGTWTDPELDFGADDEDDEMDSETGL